MSWGDELDFALKYIGILPGGELFISDRCPPDVREKVEELWPKLKVEQERRHSEDLIWTSKDYF